MENEFKDDVVDKGQVVTDKAADKLQGGIQEAKAGANSAAASAGEKIEALGKGAGEALNKAADKAQGALDSVSDTAQRAQDFAMDTQDSILAYTREQPVKALLISASIGALLVTLIRALSSSKDA